jgi:hypothetical protein
MQGPQFMSFEVHGSAALFANGPLVATAAGGDVADFSLGAKTNLPSRLFPGSPKVKPENGLLPN